MAEMSVQSLQNAHDTLACLTGHPPREFVVGPPSLVVEVGPGVVVLPEHTWRAAVQEFLAELRPYAGGPGLSPPSGHREPRVEYAMRMSGWRFREVPVDTSRLRC